MFFLKSMHLRPASIVAMAFLLIAPAVAQNAGSSPAATPTQTHDHQTPADEKSILMLTDKGAFTFTLELALNDDQRAQGLMKRTKMADDHGMLFDFGESRQIYMWMKDTYIPLDMIFLNEDGRVHHLVEKTTPLSESIIGSGGAVRFVLEVKAGIVKKTGLKKGDRLLHLLFTSK